MGYNGIERLLGMFGRGNIGNRSGSSNFNGPASGQNSRVLDNRPGGESQWQFALILHKALMGVHRQTYPGVLTTASSPLTTYGTAERPPLQVGACKDHWEARRVKARARRVLHACLPHHSARKSAGCCHLVWQHPGAAGQQQDTLAADILAPGAGAVGRLAADQRYFLQRGAVFHEYLIYP